MLVVILYIETEILKAHLIKQKEKQTGKLKKWLNVYLQINLLSLVTFF
jgi:hypothetical protein